MRIRVDTAPSQDKMRGMFFFLGNSGSLKRSALALFIASLGSATSFAGSTITSDTKDSPIVEVPTQAVVRESRGLVTSEGPSGMFINPTTATLTQGTWAFGYCVVLTSQDTDILGNHMFLSYGVRDWLELGVIAHMVNVTVDGQELPKGDYGSGGPMARVRLHRDVGNWPEISIGAYATFGTDALDSKNVFLGASKTFPIDEKGFVKTVTFQGGFRESWIEAPDRNTNRFYGGVEVRLPHDIYLIGEVTQFSHRKDEFTPWAAGIQWRGRVVGLTAAIVQSGDDSPPSIYLGIGGGLGAEPVRTPTRPDRP